MNGQIYYQLSHGNNEVERLSEMNQNQSLEGQEDMLRANTNMKWISRETGVGVSDKISLQM